MNKISVITEQSELSAPGKLYELIAEQMKIIGSEKSQAEIESAVEHALSEENRSIFFLYEIEKEAVAFAFGNICTGLESGGDYLWLNELYVDSDYRRSMIATELVIFIEKWVRDQGIEYMACITGNANAAAQSFFAKRGWELNPTTWVDKSIK